jgi:HAD superfamily hydrolase (TIGR01509 family)
MKGAIFDLDGTLIDSMGVWDKIGRDFLAARGIKAPDDLSRVVKNLSFDEVAAYYIREFALPDSATQLMAIWNAMAYREYAENIELKPGVRPYLIMLKENHIKTAIATATDRELTEAVLRRHRLREFFQAIVTVADIGKGKEHPDIFLLAAQKLQVRPQECIVFEDCLHAVAGAKQAGMKVWAVYDPASAHERPEMERIADGYIQGFAADLPALRKIWSNNI